MLTIFIVAALLRSHMIGLLPFESTIEQIAAATMIKQKQLWTAATLLGSFLFISGNTRISCQTSLFTINRHASAHVS